MANASHILAHDVPQPQEVLSSRDFCTFRFRVDGQPHGHWHLLQFTRLGVDGCYNLSWAMLCEVDEAPPIQGDRSAALEVLCEIMEAWLDRFPRRRVVLVGGSPARMRLLRLRLHQCTRRGGAPFSLHGLRRAADGTLCVAPFEPAAVPEAYLVARGIAA